MTGIVLAGGRNTRMGLHKATLPWQNADFLQVILHQLSGVCDELIVSANSPLPVDLPSVRFVADIFPQRGPLSGIHAGLTHASSAAAFVTACDMPFIRPAAVNWLCEQLQDWDAVVPGDGMFWEPLFACYAKSCLPAIESLLRQETCKTQALFGRIRCKPVPADAFRQFDPSLRLFRNINSPADYQAALKEIADPADSSLL